MKYNHVGESYSQEVRSIAEGGVAVLVVIVCSIIDSKSRYSSVQYIELNVGGVDIVAVQKGETRGEASKHNV